MRKRIFSFVAVFSLSLATEVVALDSDCEQLVGRKIGTGTIESAEYFEKDDQLIGWFKRIILNWSIPDLPELTAPVNLCRVKARLEATDNSVIMAQIWLPEDWNGKLMGGGGGGINGGYFGASLSLQSPVEKGYAAVVTDAGHEMSDSGEFAMHEAQFADWGYRANHIGALFAKELVGVFYGMPAERSYFNGCSNGGRDALMLAQRYPETYDAIIAGAPAANWTGLAMSTGWNYRSLRGEPGALGLREKLEFIQRAVIQQCDEIDGLEDDLIDNPLNCLFDPSVLLCPESGEEECLTRHEVEALNKLYSGPRREDGTQIFPGTPVGGETLENWDLWYLSEDKGQPQLGLEVFRWMIHRDADWNWSMFDIETDYPLAMERMASVVDATNPDLSEFIDGGGKLLMYHGWNDTAIPATATIKYYENVKAEIGSKMDDSVRLYMVPGMAHCSGGQGPNIFDMLDELDRWVETGVSPMEIVASEYDKPTFFAVPEGAELVRTRPLCPWPQSATYTGSGSTNEAQNFNCK